MPLSFMRKLYQLVFLAMPNNFNQLFITLQLIAVASIAHYNVHWGEVVTMLNYARCDVTLASIHIIHSVCSGNADSLFLGMKDY